MTIQPFESLDPGGPDVDDSSITLFGGGQALTPDLDRPYDPGPSIDGDPFRARLPIETTERHPFFLTFP